LPKEDKYDHRYSLPVLVGPHQDRSWVKQLKELVSISQISRHSELF